MIKKLKIITLVISILIFIISLTQPAYYTSAQEPDGWANSLGLLLMGWLGLFAGGAGFAWLANPLIIVAWIISKRTIPAIILSLLAVLFSWSFLLFNTILTSEDGHYSTITARKAGYWLWFTSILIFFVGTAIIYCMENKSSKVISTITS